MQEAKRDIPAFDTPLAAIRGLFGARADIASRLPVAGGDINDASLLVLTGGERLFLKENRSAPKGFFACEAHGLAALAAPGILPVPKPLAVGDGTSGAFLLMEYVPEGRPSPDFWQAFGAGLARLHLRPAEAVPGKAFGFFEDNYIGSSPQRNTPDASWVAFCRDMRLAPQLRLAADAFDSTDRRRFLWLLDHLDHFLREPDHPALLHGDLWSGNFLTGQDGRAWLIDPACYIGDREADLAMTELFGGFHPRFYDAYKSVCRIDADYPARRDLYQLYHLLNHLNLFGASYLPPVLSILSRFIRR